MKKTIRNFVLLTAVAATSAPLFAAIAGGDPRPHISMWAQFVQTALSFVGM
jgi:hypothetical protein